MKLLRSLDQLSPGDVGGAVSIGNFDGVHLGHARIVERLRAWAGRLGGPAVVFTFDPHPVRLLRPEQAPPPLTWTDRKAELLGALGVDTLVAYPTDEALLQFQPEDFFQTIVRQHLQARALVEGPNFYFGRDRAGDIPMLGRLCESAEIRLEVVQPVLASGDYISSSRIRQLIREGQLGEAGKLLTQPYRIRGMVTHGAARGARIGFPTANLSAVDTLLPAPGVYAGRAFPESGESPAAIHIGPNPTFGENALKVEVHLLNFAGNLYGQPLEVDFLERLRDIRPFPDLAALVDQLTRDVAEARRIGENATSSRPGR